MALSDNIFHPFPEKIRIIPYQTFPGPLNMAIDYFLSLNRSAQTMPVLRFYGWKPYCLSIGFHQQWQAIDTARLSADGFEFTRRPTGGRAIFHAEELTYSVHFPKNQVKQQPLYRFFHQLFSSALLQLGYPVELKDDTEKLPALSGQSFDYPCFTKSAQTEVQSGGKKLIGSAQKIFTDCILQHGSILVGDAHKRLAAYLKLSESERQKVVQEMEEKSVSLERLSDRKISAPELMTAIVNQLELLTNISVNWQDLDQFEIDSAKYYLSQFG